MLDLQNNAIASRIIKNKLKFALPTMEVVLWVDTFMTNLIWKTANMLLSNIYVDICIERLYISHKSIHI